MPDLIEEKEEVPEPETIKIYEKKPIEVEAEFDFNLSEDELAQLTVNLLRQLT